MTQIERDSLLISMAKTLNSVQMDISSLKSEVGSLKMEVAELKKEVAELKKDVSDLKIRMTNVEKDVKEKAAMCTPVPGGIGTITNAVLIRNIIESCEKN